MAEDQHEPDQDGDRLRGWKEIALNLRTSERTVQRWEHTLHLPVHRIETAGNAIVFGSRRELARWVKSREGQRALSERDDTEPVPAADDQSGASPTSDGESETLDAPGEAAATPVVAESPADVRPSTRRGFFWPVLALAVVALLWGFVPLAKSVGWDWTEPTKTDAAPTKPADSATATPATPRARPTIVTVRLTFEDGTSGATGIPIGDTAMCGVKGRPPYILSAALVEGGARVHVSWPESKDPQGAQRLSELAVVTLRPGERASVNHVPGLAAIEWIRVGASGRSREGTQRPSR